MKFAAVGILLLALSWPGHAQAKDNSEIVSLAPGWQRVEVDAPPGSLGLPTFRYIPDDHRNASLLITILGRGDGKVADRAALREFHLFLCRPYLTSPNEKPHQIDFNFPNGIGVYTSFEDPSLIGKPDRTGDYKVATPIALLLQNQIVIQATIFTDEKSGPTFDEALNTLKTIDLPSTPSSGLAERREGDKAILSMPNLDAELVIPGAIAESPIKLNRDTSYFSFTTKGGVILSGWLEPVAKYKGLRAMWSEEKKSMQAGTGIKCENEKFEVIDGWETVAYSMTLAKNSVQQNLRASRTYGKTWVDVHLSITAESGQTMPLKNLLRSLEIISSRRQ